MEHAFGRRMYGLVLGTVIAVLSNAVVARDPGIGVGAPGVRADVGAPGVGVRDPGINQPGRVGTVGAINVVDPGLNQPGVAGNVGGVARRYVRR